ncbi:STAS domain-containing protein [Halodesulfovibrio aestuarii]|uniref:Lipid asymmetry maintenance protein MlaB n=1 Tax=Halodesulfovibrio aestuarii TaxID=126333 RepID=A0ABV4K007_9BACT
MSFQMDIRTNRTMLRLSGILNKSAGERIADTVKPLLSGDAGDFTIPIVLDLTALEDIDTEGLAVLRHLFHQREECDEKFGFRAQENVRIANPSQKVQQKLAEAGLLPNHNGWRERLCRLPGSPVQESDYNNVLRRLRDGFPAPEPDAKQDAYLSQLICRGLDAANKYKQCDPVLRGKGNNIDYERALN